jgi:hypothetical protein
MYSRSTDRPMPKLTATVSSMANGMDRYRKATMVAKMALTNNVWQPPMAAVVTGSHSKVRRGELHMEATMPITQNAATEVAQAETVIAVQMD